MDLYLENVDTCVSVHFGTDEDTAIMDIKKAINNNRAYLLGQFEDFSDDVRLSELDCQDGDTIRYRLKRKELHLNLTFNNTITADCVSKLINLTSLDLGINITITNDCVSKLTNLTSLNLCDNNTITDDCISKLF